MSEVRYEELTYRVEEVEERPGQVRYRAIRTRRPADETGDPDELLGVYRERKYAEKDCLRDAGWHALAPGSKLLVIPGASYYLPDPRD